MVVQLASESFGILTSRGIAAWALAGAVAYFYFYLPEQRAEKQAMVSSVILELCSCKEIKNRNWRNNSAVQV